MSKNPILHAAALRGQHLNAEAIAHIENNLYSVHDDYRVLAYREAFLAARDMGDTDKAKHFASLIAKTDPDLPSIQGWI